MFSKGLVIELLSAQPFFEHCSRSSPSKTYLPRRIFQVIRDSFLALLQYTLVLTHNHYRLNRDLWRLLLPLTNRNEHERPVIHSWTRLTLQSLPPFSLLEIQCSMRRGLMARKSRQVLYMKSTRLFLQGANLSSMVLTRNTCEYGHLLISPTLNSLSF